MSAPRSHDVRGRAIDDYRSNDLFDVQMLHYGEAGLTVVIDAFPHHITVEFDLDSVIGFRVLDEGDLLEFWGEFMLADGWLFEITEGGWFDLEASRTGFLSRDHDKISEYLIVTQNDCVSVLAIRAPVVER